MKLTIAANHGTIGGGEVMLFAIAEQARILGHDVTIVAPSSPSDVIEEAKERRFNTVSIHAKSAADYLKNLRQWDANRRTGVLWCNGLRPALATAGHLRRIVELHQRPEGKLVPLSKVATRGALKVVVPSHDMASDIPGTTAMWNWTDDVRAERKIPSETAVIGFLGRPSTDKGVLVLARAMAELERRSPGKYRLLVAGESRFVDEKDRERVREALENLGEVVEQPGWMSREDFFSSVDVAVFPSVWQEPFGLVVAEAMAAKVPFVTSDAGALAEVAGDGYVAPASDHMALADQIEAAISEPEKHLDSGRERWEHNFSPEAGRARLADLLSEFESESSRVALAHDYLTQRGGAERVTLTLAQGFPGSPLTTSVYEPDGTYPEFTDLPLKTSWMQKFAPFRTNFRIGLPLYNLAFRTTKAGRDADVVVCSTTGFAHAIKTPAKKVVYCHSPARFLYLVEDYLGGPWWKSPTGWALMALRPGLIAADKAAAHSADLYLANSTIVQKRIKDVYGIDAEVVFPPHAIDAGGEQESIDGVEAPFYLVVSRLMPYKNVDVVIDAFRGLPDKRLVIIGRGPLEQQLKANLPNNVTMAQGLSDAQMRWAYANATAVIAPSKEDFGLTPVEGFAFGKPALALRAGGYLDTVVERMSGWFFDEATPDAIKQAIEHLDKNPIERENIVAHAEKFSEESFLASIRTAIEKVMK